MTAREIAAVVEEFAPLETQESWDNAGFCIGSPEQEVHGVMVALDCTKELIREAVRHGADMVVTHHPLVFGGLKKICPEDPVGAAVIEAIRSGVVIYAAHTNADKADGGVNTLMAQRLGLTDVVPVDDSGLCFIGQLPEPVSGRDFCSYVKRCFGLKVLRCSEPVEKVARVATSCGSGSSFADAAFRSGADAFVTGDVSYHHFAVPQGRMILDIGHYESEIGIVEKFVSLLQKKLPKFAVCTTENKQNNTVYYF